MPDVEILRIRLGLILLVCVLSYCSVCAQTPQVIIARLNQINLKLSQLPSKYGEGMLISNKAMNIFLSNKISSYLSDKNDLSLYKNYVNVNAAKGWIAINHNFHQPTDSDETVKSFVVVGARAEFANVYASHFSDRYTDNQLGVNIQSVWMGKPTMNYFESQKQTIDAQRALTLAQLETEIVLRSAAFEKELAKMTVINMQGQTLKNAKDRLSHDFYASLQEEILQRFAQAQSDLLIESGSYKVVKDNWTILGVYLPVIAQKFELLNNNLETHRYNYPVELSAVHTLFWDGPKFGRIFFSVAAEISINNSVLAGQLLRSNTYGTYSGDYVNFVTPATSAKLVYLPFDSHVGLSFRLEKNFGNYKAVNGILGVPIVLIDKKGVPAMNFECQLVFDDMNRSLTATLPRNRNSVGLTIGIPFSKIVY